MNKQINTTLAIAIIIIVAGIVSGAIWFGKKEQNKEIKTPAMQVSKKNAPINTTTTTPADNQAIDSMKICDGISQITDSRDTNNPIYNTVAIGTQCWLNRNLNVGRMIKGVNNQKNNKVIEKYCSSDDENNCDTDGGLYLWDEAMQYEKVDGVQGVCPIGWHIPSDKDWVVLESYLVGIKQEDCNNFETFTWGCDCSGSRVGSGCTPAGDRLKPASLCGQNEKPYCGDSGFNAVYAGDARSDYPRFWQRNDIGYLWSSTTYNSSSSWGRIIIAKWNDGVIRGMYFNTNGFSVRCIKNKK